MGTIYVRAIAYFYFISIFILLFVIYYLCGSILVYRGKLMGQEVNFTL